MVVFFRSSFLESKVDIFRSFVVGLRGLAQLDCLLSLSNVARRENFCRPIFNEKDRQISIVDGRNIIVEQISKAGSQYVANDVTFGEDGKAIMLTGPNMGGKSCYLRQVTKYKPLEAGTLINRSITVAIRTQNMYRQSPTFLIFY